MAYLLQEILALDSFDYQRIISRLEYVTMHAGVDARLTAEVITLTRQKIRQLHLDPKDSTAEEVYYALLAKAKQDDSLLRSALGINSTTSNTTSASTIATTLVDRLTPLVQQNIAIAITPSALKKILHAVPPKRTLRTLKLRSLDAVLRREDPVALYAVASQLEPATWHTQIAARMKRLSAHDVSERPVTLKTLPAAWMDRLEGHEFTRIVHSVAEVGSVVLIPYVPLTHTGAVLLSALVVLQSAQKLASEALPHRRRGVIAGLHSRIPLLRVEDAEGTAIEQVHGLQLSWTVLHQVLAEHMKGSLPETEFILGDLEWTDVETKMASIVPALDFWVGSHYLALRTSGVPVSFHCTDVAASVVLSRSYQSHVISHMRSSLWNELQLRYLKEEALERAVITQLTKEEMVYY